MELKLIRMMVGMYQSNCYILFDEDNDAVIIDPGAEGKRIVETIEKHNLNPKMILLTHGHSDHYGGVNDVLSKYDIPLYMSKEDQEMLEKDQKNIDRALGGFNIGEIKASHLVKDSDEIKFKDKVFKVVATPGHTKGSLCFIIDNAMFSGDMLFQGSIGRTDLPGGNYDEIMKSLKQLLEMPAELVVYPGHGGHTTIGFEKENNYFARLL